MVQVKKVDVQDAILKTAFDLFLEHGYTHTTLSTISRISGVTVSNIYNYFDSKLDILMAIYQPWFDAQLTQLIIQVEKQESPEARFNRLILGLLKEIPEKDGGFAHLWMEAISARQPGEIYSRDMLLRLEDRISAVLKEILPPNSAERYTQHNLLSHLLFMAFDGFAINFHTSGTSKRAEAIAELLTTSVFLQSTS